MCSRIGFTQALNGLLARSIMLVIQRGERSHDYTRLVAGSSPRLWRDELPPASLSKNGWLIECLEQAISSTRWWHAQDGYHEVVGESLAWKYFYHGTRTSASQQPGTNIKEGPTRVKSRLHRHAPARAGKPGKSVPVAVPVQSYLDQTSGAQSRVHNLASIIFGLTMMHRLKRSELRAASRPNDVREIDSSSSRPAALDSLDCSLAPKPYAFRPKIRG